MEKFIEEYTRQLEQAVRDYPHEYRFPPIQVPAVVGRMRKAFADGSYNKDGRAIKATCKALGIPHTYKAISAYLAGKTPA